MTVDTATLIVNDWTDCRCTAYGGAMAPSGRADNKTPNRVFRLDDETWTAYALACEAKGISRSDDIRMHIKATVAAFGRDQRRAAREADKD